MLQISCPVHEQAATAWQVASPSLSCLQTLLSGILEQSELEPQVTVQVIL